MNLQNSILEFGLHFLIKILSILPINIFIFFIKIFLGKSMTDDSQNINQRGWLKKRGNRVKKWSDRYFILHGEFISYFIKEGDVVRAYNLIDRIIKLLFVIVI